jgi:hypothetical protein
MNRHNKLKILQYNVRRSRDMVMASLLRNLGIDDFDLIAIQEPWKNPYTATTHHPIKDRFYLCYPTGGTVAVLEEEGDCIVCLEMRANELMRRLISSELANYRVVRTSPEPLHIGLPI